LLLVVVLVLFQVKNNDDKQPHYSLSSFYFFYEGRRQAQLVVIFKFQNRCQETTMSNNAARHHPFFFFYSCGGRRRAQFAIFFTVIEQALSNVLLISHVRNMCTHRHCSHQMTTMNATTLIIIKKKSFVACKKWLCSWWSFVLHLLHNWWLYFSLTLIVLFLSFITNERVENELGTKNILFCLCFY